MNERIEQLADLADDLADEIIQMPGEYHPNWHGVRDRKFAELIIRECSLFVFKQNGPKSALNLLEHFGVEE